MEQTFTLPGGYLDSDGIIHKEVVLTPVTGRVRRAMGTQQSRKRGYSMFNTILSKCIKRIGSIEKITREVLDNMLSGDRSFCTLMIRSFRSPMIKAEAQCPSCDEVNLYELPISDYSINYVDEDSYRIEEYKGTPYMVFDIRSAEYGIEASFRYSNGSDEKITEPILAKNPLAAQFEMWHRCLMRWNINGAEIDRPWSKTVFDDLFDNQMEFLDDEFDAHQPGPMAIQYDYCACGSEVMVSLAKSDFLLPLPGAMKRRYSARS